jgi:glucokinase
VTGSDLILVADIGGTNTRVALGDRAGQLHHVRTVRNVDVRDLREPLEAAIGSNNITDAVLAVAGPVDGDNVAVTNHPWKISQPLLRKSLGLARLTLINDFLAAAYAAPTVGDDELLYLQGGAVSRRGNILVCGPGTGFGVAALIDSARGRVGIASEAGHIILGAADGAEEAVFDRLRKDGEPIGVETILSGEGLSRLYGAMNSTPLRSEEIISRLQAGDSKATTSVSLFLSIFGRVSGDLALAYNAMSGVFLTGGVGRALARHYQSSPFLDSFRNHPPFSRQLMETPVAVLLHEQPGLLGALQFGLAQPV